MPRIESMTVTAQELRKGDYIPAMKLDVERTEFNRVNGKIYGTDLHGNDKFRNAKRGDLLEIRRNVPTEAEQEASKAEMMEDWLNRSRNRAARELIDLQQKVVNKMNDDHTGLDHWDLEPLLMAQEVERLWRTVEIIQERNESSLADAYAIIVNKIKEDRTSAIGQRRSRSTSILSNAIEDVKFDAASEFLRALGYGF